MILNISDWSFDVDVEATRNHTTKNALDHCTCAYCKNYYEAVAQFYPELLSFLEQFGINFHGPSELMPFEPTLLLGCYRISGNILQWGSAPLFAENVAITVESADNGTFLLWVGEVLLPWLQEEDMDEVVSPANLPEFLERMEEVWFLRHGNDGIMS